MRRTEMTSFPPAGGGAAALLEPPAPAPRRRAMEILAVGDDEELRTLLRAALDAVDAELAEASSVAWARILIDDEPPDVVLLDTDLLGPSGLTFCQALKGDPATEAIAVVVVAEGEDARRDGLAAGADACLPRPFEPVDLLRLVLPTAGLDRPSEIEHRRAARIESARREAVELLCSALEEKCTETRAHSHRVRLYAMALAAALDPALLESLSVEYGFLLHDVGKIGIPDAILQKPAALTSTERSLVETHAVIGELMLAGVELLRGEGLAVVRHHHERWDGRGYPDGLAGEAIPLAARVFAVADSLDAMTSDRPYRAASTWEAAVQEIVAESGRQFDPGLVAAFLAHEPRLRTIYEQLAGESADLYPQDAA